MPLLTGTSALPCSNALPHPETGLAAITWLNSLTMSCPVTSSSNTAWPAVATTVSGQMRLEEMGAVLCLRGCTDGRGACFLSSARTMKGCSLTAMPYPISHPAGFLFFAPPAPEVGRS